MIYMPHVLLSAFYFQNSLKFNLVLQMPIMKRQHLNCEKQCSSKRQSKSGHWRQPNALHTNKGLINYLWLRFEVKADSYKSNEWNWRSFCKTWLLQLEIHFHVTHQVFVGDQTVRNILHKSDLNVRRPVLSRLQPTSVDTKTWKLA